MSIRRAPAWLRGSVLMAAVAIVVSLGLTACSGESDPEFHSFEEWSEAAGELPTQEDSDAEASREIDEDDFDDELERLKAEIAGE